MVHDSARTILWLLYLQRSLFVQLEEWAAYSYFMSEWLNIKQLILSYFFTILQKIIWDTCFITRRKLLSKVNFWTRAIPRFLNSHKFREKISFDGLKFGIFFFKHKIFDLSVFTRILFWLPRRKYVLFHTSTEKSSVMSIVHFDYSCHFFR